MFSVPFMGGGSQNFGYLLWGDHKINFKDGTKGITKHKMCVCGGGRGFKNVDNYHNFLRPEND